MTSQVAVPAAATPSGPVDFNKDYDPQAVRGKTAIVTGGASGIGLALVEALARAGACVVIGDLNEELGQKEVKRLQAEGYNVHFHNTDVTSYASQLALFKHAVLTCSPTRAVDIVIPSAGVHGDSKLLNQILHSIPSTPSLDADPVQPVSLASFTINLEAVYITVYLALYYFKATSTSTIEDKQLLLIASLAAYGSWPARLDYPASKQGVRALWKGLRGIPSSLLGYSFRTNLLAPSFVATPMMGGFTERLTNMGIHVAETRDCVEVGMRFICDDQIKGRVVCITPPGGKPGWLGVSTELGSFDLCDDEAGFEGIKAMKDAIQRGCFGPGFGKTNIALMRPPDTAREAALKTGEAQTEPPRE